MIQSSSSASISDVALVWEPSITTRNATTVPCIKISLQPATKDESNSQLEYLTTSAEVADGSIPESVLRYERQLRKAQHAKKVGQSPPELQVIHVDESIVVVNKPAGVLTVPGLNGHPSLLDRVYALYGEAVTDPANMIVHRLDMDTSGLVIFARSLEVSKQMHAIFRDRKVVKEYECLVMGHLPEWQKDDEDLGSSNMNTPLLIDLPLQRDHEHPPFMRVSTPLSEAAAMACVDQLQKHGWKKIIRKSAKPSQSLVTILEVGTRESRTTKQSLPFTRLRLEPITGRTHQLRVHWYDLVVFLSLYSSSFINLSHRSSHLLHCSISAAIGFPIVGDPTYSLYGEAALFGGLHQLKSYKHCAKRAVMNEIDGLPRCSVDTMKAWTSEHPPNVKPMCLHAALLELYHPVTGQLCRWHALPDF